MKNLILALITTLLFSLTGCKKEIKEAPNPNSAKTENAIAGEWYLVRYQSSGFSTPHNYTNEIKWTFNDETVRVNIKDNTEITEECPLNSNGSYTYVFNEQEQHIILNNVSYPCGLTDNDKLLISIGGGSCPGTMELNKVAL